MGNDTNLTKKILYEIIISTLLKNKLGYSFLKFNKRYYYFKRNVLKDDATDFMIICVYLKQGYISCELQSNLYKSIRGGRLDGMLNKYAFLHNSNSKSAFGPEIWRYYFQKTELSLKSTLNLILSDLDIKGREFISSCDSRYTNPKFRIGLEFMSNLSIAKDVLDDIYPKNFYGYWWKLNNEKFIELENLFNEVDKTNELENNMKNSFFAFEFFDKYISDYYRNWRKK